MRLLLNGHFTPPLGHSAAVLLYPRLAQSGVAVQVMSAEAENGSMAANAPPNNIFQLFSTISFLL